MRGPDPTEFEPEFAIGDDDASSRSATPRPESTSTSEDTQGEKSVSEETESTADTSISGKETAPGTETNQPPPELTPEVKAKLRRLAKLESRYQGTSVLAITSCKSLICAVT